MAIFTVQKWWPLTTGLTVCLYFFCNIFMIMQVYWESKVWHIKALGIVSFQLKCIYSKTNRTKLAQWGPQWQWERKSSAHCQAKCSSIDHPYYTQACIYSMYMGGLKGLMTLSQLATCHCSVWWHLKKFLSLKGAIRRGNSGMAVGH